jgi:AraC family transcriptional regulator
VFSWLDPDNTVAYADTEDPISALLGAHALSFFPVAFVPASLPVRRLYGESLAIALIVYLLSRYAARRYTPEVYKRGLPGYRLKRVRDYVGDNLTEDLSLSQLAALSGVSPRYFAELFRQSMGCPPHRYVLLQRIERAKQGLRDPTFSVTQAGVDAGFQNPSHFARVFRKFVGVSASRFQSDWTYRSIGHVRRDPIGRWLNTGCK